MRILNCLVGLLMTLSARSEPEITRLPLWPEGHAEIRDSATWETMEDWGRSGAPDRRHANITRPEMEVYQPDSANGASVLILPGGGYSYVVIDKEGRDIARWFNSIGVTAFVLKYRLPATRAGLHDPELPLRDARRAMRLIRSRTAEWDVDSSRLGVIGFSAGGHLASMLGTTSDLGRPGDPDPVEREPCRPAFLMLGYPVISMDSAITHT
ncbi:MAG: alpha/beta hydrolase, partial [Verrucomicrobiaceae bacterium]